MGARATGVMRVTRSPIFSGGPACSQRLLTTCHAADGVQVALALSIMHIHCLPSRMQSAPMAHSIGVSK